MDEDEVEAQTLDVSDSIGTDESDGEQMSPVDISEAPAPQTGRRKPGKAAASKAAAPKPRTAKYPAAPAPASATGRQPVKAPRAAPAARPTRPGPSAEVSEYRTTAEMLKLVSDATRLSIVDMLREGPLNVGEICDRLEVQSQPAVSHHIALLRHGRVIIPSRQGKNNYYSLTPEYGNTLARLVAGLMAS
jgi:DNA-binding transcriptional ArsR family regulator